MQARAIPPAPACRRNDQCYTHATPEVFDPLRSVILCDVYGID
jgi:hypothetical protein